MGVRTFTEADSTRIWELLNELGVAISAVTELGAGVDLNTVTDTGDYTQSQSDDAASGTNYPEAIAGHLRVVSSAGGNTTWQKYTPYGQYAVRTWVRGKFGSTWYPWALDNYDSTPWMSASAAGFSANFASLAASSMVRKVNGICFVSLSGNLSGAIGAGNVSNVNLWNIPATWGPDQSNGSLGAGSNGSMWAGYASIGNVITLGATAAAYNSGDIISCVGSWAR